MTEDEPWDMGHKLGFEFWKHPKIAMERGITRKELLDGHKNPDHHHPKCILQMNIL
ncbi:GH-E family nuclease [Lentibacillus salinarum]|uniref:GH-E family nuclease n=1 Tax=Lentibacillus salinarum TaxID=446820 RepID=A0ABW3ZX05_9BACI